MGQTKATQSIPHQNPFLPEVWRIQRQIFLHPYAVRLEEFAQHPAIIELAQQLAVYYFKQSYKRTTTAFEQICHYYVLAILLYPLQAKLLHRVYKPFWSYPVICSWLRKCVSTHTKQYFCHQIELPVSQKNYSILFDTLKKTDKNWLQFQLDRLDHEGQRGTVSGKLCRRITTPFAYFNFDEKLNQNYGVAETHYKRKVRRKAGKPTASSIRIDNKIWLFGDKNCSKTNGWIDLREQASALEWFVLRYQDGKKGEGINISIDPVVVNNFRHEIRVIFDGKGNPHFKFHLINKKTKNFVINISGANGASQQLFDLDRWLSQKIRKKILSNLGPEYQKKMRQQILDLKKSIRRELLHPVNLFHEEKVNPQQCLAIYSPYR